MIFLKGEMKMKKALVILLFSLFVIVQSAKADRLKDFQNAVKNMQDDQGDPNGKACFSIPCSDFRMNACGSRRE
jgi:hypothetical protein